MTQSIQVYGRSQSRLQPAKKIQKSMPNRYHYDPDHYQRELEVIWYKMWVNLCRSDEVASPRDYKVFTIGDQNVVVTRDLKGNLRAFHNTCRHRGSILCTEEQGRFKGGSIVCPYHAWTYSLEGDLIATPHQLESADFDMKDYSLYDIAIGEWGGFVFVNLSGDQAEPLEQVLGEMPARFKNYHTEDLKVGFRYVADINSNWKLWHENYSECFHCPDNHPELCKIVPVYGQGHGPMEEAQWEDTGGETMTRVLRAGYDIIEGGQTWTMDGQLSGPTFSGLTEEERSQPSSGSKMRPNFFFSVHPDYIHTQTFFPTSPTTFRVTWDYLFEPSTMERDDFDAKRAYELWHITNLQDAQNVEWQQAGLMAGRGVHEYSVFVPQERGPHSINQWILQVLGKAEPGSEEE